MKKPDRDESTTFVNIATLKAQLAKYLRMVRSGRDVIVTDHKLPVARLVPIESAAVLETVKPDRPFSECSRREVPPLEGNGKIDSLSALLSERGSR